jgi:hypothetical protein
VLTCRAGDDITPLRANFSCGLVSKKNETIRIFIYAYERTYSIESALGELRNGTSYAIHSALVVEIEREGLLGYLIAYLRSGGFLGAPS